MDRVTKTFVEKEQDEQNVSDQQTISLSNDNNDFPGYNTLSDLTKLTLRLEKLLNGAVNKKAETSKIIGSKKGEIEPLLGELIDCMKSTQITYVESLQIRRLINTLEFDTLDSFPPLKKCKQTVLTTFKKLVPIGISPSLEDEQLQNKQITLMYAAVSEIWAISIEEFTKLIKNLKFARHGETSTSALATWPQVEGCFGELMICSTMVQMIDQEAKQSGLYKWSLDGLMIQILQNTARRFKVKTILDAVKGINELQPLLLDEFEKEHISKKAFTSIRECLQYHIVDAVSDKAKEQFRQLQILTCVLQKQPEFVCVGYEELVSNASGSDIRADILFDGGNAGKFAIEIESLADKNQAKAYEYLKGQYQKKMKIIGNAVQKDGYSLVLVLPLGTQILQEQWKLIQEDSSIKVWLLEM